MLLMALIAIFASAILLRAFPAKYGFYLNEFDPYYDYYASRYLVERFDAKGFPGLFDYFTWVDTKTWYPEGRPVATSSQVGLHFAGALLYLTARNGLGMNISLYDFLVLFPVLVGALTVFAVYLLVKKLAGTTAGLFGALVIAFSPPIIQRGALGWFKSEPFALLLAVFASYLFISIYDVKTGWQGLAVKAVAAGFLLGYANTSWGGSFYFSIVFGLFLFVAPFVNIDLRKTILAGSLLVSNILLFSSMFPRPGPSFIVGPVGALLLGSVAFALASYRIKTSVDPSQYVRTVMKVLVVFALLGLAAISFGLVSGVSGRYLTVVFPYEKSFNPLVESVAEHFTPTGTDYFSSYFLFLFLGAFGALMAFRKRTVYHIFALLLGISGIYIAASFSRLMVFSSVAFAALASIGFIELTSAVIKPAVATAAKKKTKLYAPRTEIKIIYTVFMITLLTVPLAYPAQAGWLAAGDVPVSLANGSTAFRTQIPDWVEALRWIRENHPGAVFAAWWDYGYWIAVMGNGTSLADNATINQTRIAQLGRMFMSNETDALKILKDLRADYVVVYVAALRFEQQQGQFVYFLQDPTSGRSLGGDESKKQWFIRISRIGNVSDYLHEDEFTPKENFWENTLLGKMMPFTQLGFLGQSGQLEQEYSRGTLGVYALQVKYSGTSPDPLRLAFASSSLGNPIPIGGSLSFTAAVLIYEIVK